MESLKAMCARVIVAGYRTVSEPASAVLAGLLPLHLVFEGVRNQSIRYQFGSEARFLRRLFRGRRKAETKREINEMVRQTWQEEWEGEARRSVTFEFFSTVDTDIKISGNKMTCLLTGYGVV